MKAIYKIIIILSVILFGFFISFIVTTIYQIPLNTITAIALVVVTIAYAFFTYLLYEVQNRNQKLISKPLLSANPYFISPGIMFIQIANIGNGPAINVNIKCRTNPHSTLCEWNTNFLPPKSDPIIFKLDEVHLKEIISKYSEIIIETDYVDLDGQPGTPKTIQIETSKLERNKGVIWRPDFHKQMEGIKDELHEVSKNLSDIHKIEKKFDKLDDINISLKRLSDINLNVTKINDIDKDIKKMNNNIAAIETSIRGLGPILKKKK